MASAASAPSDAARVALRIIVTNRNVATASMVKANAIE